MFVEIIILLFSLLFLFLYGRMLHGRFTLPPGPIPLPIFGNLLQLNERRPQKTIREWSKQYGPVFTMWMANSPVIVVTDFEIIKDALTRHGDLLSGRYRNFSSDVITHGNYGVLVSDGDIWREQRRFSMQIFRSFGMGHRVMDERILTEARYLSDSIKEDMKFQPQAVLDLQYETTRCVGNIIASLVFGHRYPKGDPRFTLMHHTQDEKFETYSMLSTLLVNSWPWFRHVPLFGHFGTDELRRQEKTIREYLVFEIECCKEELKNLVDKGEEPLNFVDAYLKEMKRREDSVEGMSFFSDWQLVALASDFIAAGMETSVTTLRWAYLAMVKFPHVQRKVFEEIDHVIGRDRSPSMSDRSSMPYVMATLNEVQRWRYILPINFVRTNETDFELGGYKLPKTAQVIPQISTLAIDEKVFPSPDEFIPERFLEDDGKTLKKIDQFIPFSIGKRTCLGEGLARAEIFLIFVHMMQHFELAVPPGVPQPSDEPITRVTAQPEPFQVLVKLRNDKA